MSYTLESHQKATQLGFGNSGSPSSWMLRATSDDFTLPTKSFAVPKGAASINAFGNDNFDNRAPGVRDLMTNPSLFARTEHRTNLYDNNRIQANAPPALNYYSGSNGGWENFDTNPAAQRLGQFWWNTLHVPAALDTVGFIERGQYVTPHTGFTAFRFLRPATTVGLIQ
jgi:hypothetical protein